MSRRGGLVPPPWIEEGGCPLKRVVAVVGTAVLALLATAGLALSLAYVVVATDAGRALLVPRIVRAVDDAIVGRIELRGFRLLAGGGIELFGVRVIGPDEDVVLRVERIRVQIDVSRLRSRAIGFRVDVESPVAVLQREEDGSLSLARAFAPTHPSPRDEAQGPTTWTVRLTHLSLRGGSVRYVDAQRRTAFEAEGLDVDGRAAYGPRGARLELAVRGAMVAPEHAPIALEVAGGVRDGDLRLRTLHARVGDTAVDAAAQLDTRSWRGRAAVLALAIDAAQVGKALPAVPLAGDLSGTLYAESDGSTASAALDLRPARGGTAMGAGALRLPPAAAAAGLELQVAGLDLSRVLRGAPATRIDLEAHGHGSGRDLGTLRGALAASLAPSRLRGGAVGPIELRATADRGAIDLSRLDATVPGATLHARGRWRRGGALAGTVALDAADLGAARRNGELLLDRRLPDTSGTLHVTADVSGTERAPALALRIQSAALGVGTVSATEVAIVGQVAGPLAEARAALDGTVGALTAGTRGARALRLSARIEHRAGEVSVTGEVPGLGRDSLALHAAGQLAAGGRVLQVTALSLGWPGARFELQQPARVTLEPPSVDALVLAAGPQRIEVTGGLRGSSYRRTVEARVRLQALDLLLLPRALLPASLELAGRVTADVSASGPVAGPRVAGRLELVDGAAAGVHGLSARAEVAWDGGRRRVHAEATLRRARGGRLELRADLPVPLAARRRAEPLALDASASGWPVPLLLRLARKELPQVTDGVLGAELHAAGTAGGPTLTTSVTLQDGRYGDFAPVAATLRLEDGGAEAALVASLDHAGARVLDVLARTPLRLADVLRAPGALRRVLAQPVSVVATIPDLDLATVAGRGEVPEDLRGRLQARAEVSGTLRAPRGVVTVTASEVAHAGYRALSGEVRLTAREAATTAEVRAAIAGDEIGHGSAALGLPVERLARRDEREAASLQVRVEIPHADLREASSGVPVALAGLVTGRASLDGTLAAARADLAVEGKAIVVDGHPLGDVTLRGSAREGAVHGALQLAAPRGGTLDAALDVDAALALRDLRGGAFRRAPARARLVANQLDLGFLPAVLPRVVRSASGKLGADVVAKGTLGKLVPRGTVALAGGAVSVAEFGEWHDLAFQASLSEDAFRIERLEAHRRGGKVTLTAEAKGLARDTPAQLHAELRSEGLTVPREGQDLATLDLDAKLTGTFSAHELQAELQIPGGTVRLPNRVPRQIQSLDPRPDIVIGPPRRRRAEPLAAAGPPAPPYHARVHVLSPGHLFVKSDNPRMNIELRADVTVDYASELTLEGDVDTVRGQVEPIGGRIFDLKRGRVHFTGAELSAATLEIQAVYDNPAAKVNVAVTGTVNKPDIKLTSEPPMDESQIALLIATGHTELKAGSGGVGTLSRDQAGYAALGAVATQVFKDVVADKLPVDSVSLDSSQLRAGKYVTDKIYVGYTRRFNANPELGENTNEVRVEYQISPRWTFESSYGDAQTGGASLIWSKDY